jgi:hypothetical protein
MHEAHYVDEAAPVDEAALCMRTTIDEGRTMHECRAMQGAALWMRPHYG